MPVRKITQSELDELFEGGLTLIGMGQLKKNYETEKVMKKRERKLERTAQNHGLINPYRKSIR